MMMIIIIIIIIITEWHMQVPWSRGRCLAWDATCPDTLAVSHVLASSTRAGSAAATAEAMKSQKYADISQLASISSLLRSRHREPGASRPFTSSWRSAADWQLWPTIHGQQRLSVSVFRWRFSAAMPSAWRGHFGALTQRPLRWTIEQGLVLLLVVHYFVISLCCS